MNILVFAPYAINTPHFETDLEIIQKHLDDGDDVTVIGCNGHFSACDVNITHELTVCIRCVGRRLEGLKLLSKDVTVLPVYNLSDVDRKEVERLPDGFTSIEQLKQWRIDTFEIGYAVLSSLISIIKEPEPDVIKYREVIRRLVLSSHAVYRSIQNYLAVKRFDRAYVYNGRYSVMRAAFRGCRSWDVDCWLHERGSTHFHYDLIKNSLSHDLEKSAIRMREHWNVAVNADERVTMASQFYIDKQNGISPRWIVHSKDQEKGLLPDNWDERKLNIVIFSSSEDEFSAIGDMWKNPIYVNQLDGLRKIIGSVSNDKRLHLYLRVHPNLRNSNSKDTRDILGLKAENLTVISPESRVSSYALLYKASKVVTFGSTLGIEAVYWGIPSILAGPCLYRSFNSTYNPRNHEELIEMLHADLPPKANTGALIFGFYFGTRGIAFKYFKPTGLFAGKFKGVAIKHAGVWEILAEVGLAKTPSDRLLSPKSKSFTISEVIEHINSGNLRRAVDSMDNCAFVHGDKAKLDYLRAITSARLGEWRRAIEFLTRFLAEFPHHQKACVMKNELADIETAQNRFEQRTRLQPEEKV